MRCPVCRKKTVWEGNSYRPFCGERCQLLDLDNWLSERYGISAAAETRDKTGAPPRPAQNAKRNRD
jgi:endogenous inhibitor of DNA gyrase (YacG/DUF329 family)